MLKASDYNQADIDADGALITSQPLVLSDPRSSQDIDKVKQAVGSAVHICASEGCEKEANMVCPTCIKFSAPPTHFCDQECFKKSWNDHKLVHTEIKVQAKKCLLFNILTVLSMMLSAASKRLKIL